MFFENENHFTKSNNLLLDEGGGGGTKGLRFVYRLPGKLQEKADGKRNNKPFYINLSS